MTEPNHPFRHWDIYARIRIGVIAVAALFVLYTIYRLF
jgi:hypothetical protein